VLFVAATIALVGCTAAPTTRASQAPASTLIADMAGRSSIPAQAWDNFGAAVKAARAEPVVVAAEAASAPAPKRRSTRRHRSGSHTRTVTRAQQLARKIKVERVTFAYMMKP
jgi:hypothetical protein